MTERRTIWQWATAYVGDPRSWELRGKLILEFLWENGLMANHNVLDIGCGNLSEGAPLIRALDPGRFVGIEPGGWLVEAALEEMPDLLDRDPEFLWRTDFDASELDRRFDFIVSHSVLSHCAHHQLDELLVNTRKVVDEGAVFLCSYRADQFNSWAKSFQYPDHTTFRLQTVQAAGYHHGWRVEPMHSYRERMMTVCPNDVHDWLKLTAIKSLAEINDLRLADEAEQDRERDDIADAESERVALLEQADRELTAQAGL